MKGQRMGSFSTEHNHCNIPSFIFNIELEPAGALQPDQRTRF